MAVTECAHLQGIVLAVDEINNSGGINGRSIEPIVMDPQGDDARYTEYATELLLKHRVNYIFGSCLSTSRKAVLPLVERYNGILFYPSVYEGFEYSTNVVYGGAVPNQMVLPLLEYIYSNYGRRIALIGSDTLYAREINRIVTEFLESSGGEVTVEHYLPFGCSSDQATSALEGVSQENTDVVLSTVVGEDCITLYNTFSEHPDKDRKLPIASLTTTESELAKMKPKAREGHLSVSPYFGSLDSPQNRNFTRMFESRYGTTNMPGVYSEVCYSLMHLFANAAKQCDAEDSDEVIAALSGSVFKGPNGDMFLDMETNHFTLRPLIGKATADGSFDIIHRSPYVVKADPYLITYDRSVSGSMAG